MFKLYYLLSLFFLFICLLFFSSAHPLSPQGDNLMSLTKCAKTEKRQHSYLWTVRHPSVNGTVHLFGYLRVPAPLIWPFVFQKVKRLFSESDVAVFEYEIGADQLAECIRQQKSNETEHLSASLEKRLDEFTRRPELRSPIPRMQWTEMSSKWLVLSLLHVLSNRELLSLENETKIDVKLKEEAETNRKQLDFVGNYLPELCDYLPSFDHQQLEFVIEHLIDELEMLEKADVDLEQGSTRTSIGLYNCGMFEMENDLIGRSFLSPKAKGNAEQLDELNKRLISDIFTRRNERWIHKIVQLIQQSPQKRIFFAFGTGHLLSNDSSIVQLLRLRGYSVDEQQYYYEPNEENEETKNDKAKSAADANQQKSESNNSFFWTFLIVAIAFICVFALCGIVKNLMDNEQNRGTAENGRPIIMHGQNGHFDRKDTEEGQMTKNEEQFFGQNGHFEKKDTEKGQMTKNES